MKKVISTGLVLLLLPFGGLGQSRFEKIKIQTGFGTVEPGTKGTLLVTGKTISFQSNKGSMDIATDAVSEIFYSKVAGRRIKSTVISGLLFWPAAPAFFFFKGKKHYLTLMFNDQEGTAGALEFQLDKKNYRGVMRALQAATGKEVVFDQEGLEEPEKIGSKKQESN